MKFEAKKILLALACVAAGVAHAGMTKDKHGNVGFDTLAECQAAVLGNTVGFYQPFSSHGPKMLNGATTVKKTTLREALQEKADVKGYCNVGMGRSQGRDGVTLALQGKYIPLSPNMDVNAYRNAQGELVTIRMRKCDNWMNATFTPVTAAPAAPVAPVAPVAKPVAVVAPAPVVAPVAAAAPALVAAPVAAAVAPFTTAAAPVAEASTGAWRWLLVPVAVCALFDCTKDGSNGANTTTTTTTTSR